MDAGAQMLTATRRIEDATGALAVLPTVRGMPSMAEQFAREARTVRADAIALASEVTQYRGRLEHALAADAATTEANGLEPPAAMYWWTPGFAAVLRGWESLERVGGGWGSRLAPCGTT